jgi:hypothetical protein
MIFGVSLCALMDVYERGQRLRHFCQLQPLQRPIGDNLEFHVNELIFSPKTLKYEHF